MDTIFQAWRAEGKAEGMAEGKAEAFLKLARSKFRRVPKDRQAQVRAATMPQLDIWLDRILTATSLKEVFDSDGGEEPAVNRTPPNRLASSGRRSRPTTPGAPLAPADRRRQWQQHSERP